MSKRPDPIALLPFPNKVQIAFDMPNKHDKAVRCSIDALIETGVLIVNIKERVGSYQASVHIKIENGAVVAKVWDDAMQENTIELLKLDDDDEAEQAFNLPEPDPA